jgi:hypothetical protein
MAREKSPLPGWDPYLQRFWRDVHHRLITNGDFGSDIDYRSDPGVLLDTLETQFLDQQLRSAGLR